MHGIGGLEIRIEIKRYEIRLRNEIIIVDSVGVGRPMVLAV